MELINPITFTYGMLTSASVAEDDTYSAWSSVTAYVVGNTIYLASTHTIYVCLINNTNVSPETSIAPVASPKWGVVGATNKYKAFDTKWGTRTVATSSLTMTLTPGKAINSLGLINLLGDSVHVVCTVGATTKYDQTFNLQTDVGVYDWSTYFMADIVIQDDLVLTDLLPYVTQVITITVTGVGTVGIGNIAMGAYVDLGDTEYGTSIGITDFSVKTEDDYGNIEVVERSYRKRYSCSFAVDTSFVDQLESILASVRAKSVVWTGAGSNFSSLIVWGYFKDFEIDLAGPTLSHCTLTIEGIV